MSLKGIAQVLGGVDPETATAVCRHNRPKGSRGGVEEHRWCGGGAGEIWNWATLIPKAKVCSGWRVCEYADLGLRGPPATREQERLWMRAGGL